MPLFSIVLVDYQGVNSHATFLRGYNSIMAQTFRDFELLCFHDGPLLRPADRFPTRILCSRTRFNDWGHSLRDAGIQLATGDYMLFFNADNILYPDALAEIAREIERAPRLVNANRLPLDTNDIIIFPILMWNLVKFRDRAFQIKRAPEFYVILTGVPPVMENIDCMQFVMKRSLWIAEGGWHDKSKYSDGILFPAFAAKYGHRCVGPVLGEHF